jgi:exodeoxyribonuclease VII small subunit
MDSAKKINLEKSISDLEKLVNELESGDLSLEKAIKKFEEGIKLSRKCQTALKEAEQKIEILLGDDTSEKVTSFTKDEEDS